MIRGYGVLHGYLGTHGYRRVTSKCLAHKGKIWEVAVVAEVALKSQYRCAGRKVKMLYVVQSIAPTATRLPLATSRALATYRSGPFWADLDSPVLKANRTRRGMDLAIPIRK